VDEERRAESGARLVTTFGFPGGGIVQLRVDLAVTMRTEDADGETLDRAAAAAALRLRDALQRFVEDGGLTR
jgi:hypothetical protein